MSTLFNGDQIFGTSAVKLTGYTPGFRGQREYLPGVGGYRIYQLGRDAPSFNYVGRLSETSLAGLYAKIELYGTYVNGALYTLTQEGGATHTNCELQSYNLASEIQKVTYIDGVTLFTCLVSGVIRHTTPAP